MKIRIEVRNQEQLDIFLKCIKSDFSVQSVSKMYPNRDGIYNRVYIDVEEKR